MVAPKNQKSFDELAESLKDNPPGVTPADRFRLLEKAVGLRPTPKDKVRFPDSLHTLLYRMKAQRARDLMDKSKRLNQRAKQRAKGNKKGTRAKNI